MDKSVEKDTAKEVSIRKEKLSDDDSEYDIKIKIEQDLVPVENIMDEDDENIEFFTCDGCKKPFDITTFETHIEKCSELAKLVESVNRNEEFATTERNGENEVA